MASLVQRPVPECIREPGAKTQQKKGPFRRSLGAANQKEQEVKGHQEPSSPLDVKSGGRR